MPFTMIVTFQAKPGEEQRLHDELGAMIEPSLAEPGCLNYRPLVDPNQPGAMVIIEEWTGETALEEHFATHTSSASRRCSTRSSSSTFAATTLTRLEVAQAANHDQLSV